MTRLHLLLPALLLGACGPADEAREDSQSAEIECVGMTYGIPLGGYSRVATRFGGRCNWLISDTIYDDRPALATAENLGAENTVALTFVTRGRVWTARTGDVRITRNEGNLMTGTYDVLATDPQGEQLRIRGPFDFCAYGNRADCPHQSSGGLSKRLSFAIGDGARAHPEATWLSACRVLIDRRRAGVQVDLQIGVFNGINIAHWVDQCEVGAAPLDRFTFRSGGVAGPGSYGPYTTRALPHPDSGEAVVLPHLSFNLPLHYLGFSTACLTDLGRSLDVWTEPDVTSCAWTIEENPGRFTLSCNDALRRVTRDPLGQPTDFTLEADCDVRYTD